MKSHSQHFPKPESLKRSFNFNICHIQATLYHFYWRDVMKHSNVMNEACEHVSGLHSGKFHEKKPRFISIELFPNETKR